jgi:hypothetical protein
MDIQPSLTRVAFGLVMLSLWGCDRNSSGGQPESNRSVCTASDIVPRVECLTQSPRGDLIALVDIAARPPHYLRIYDAKRHAMVRTIELPGFLPAVGAGVSWSGDQKWLALAITEGLRLPSAVWRVSLVDGHTDKLLQIPDEILQNPRISQRNDAVLMYYAKKRDLGVLDLTTGKHRQVTAFGDVSRFGFDWMTTRDHVLLSRGHLSPSAGIIRYRFDTQEATVLFPKAACELLRVSPSGRLVAYSQARQDSPGYELWICRVDEGDAAVKISMTASLFFSWSCQNDKLAFFSSGRLAVWESDADAPRTLDADLRGGYYPAWADGDREIYFLREGSQLWSIDARTGVPTLRWSAKPTSQPEEGSKKG